MKHPWQEKPFYIGQEVKIWGQGLAFFGTIVGQDEHGIVYQCAYPWLTIIKAHTHINLIEPTQ